MGLITWTITQLAGRRIIFNTMCSSLAVFYGVSGRFADFYCLIGLWVTLKFLSSVGLVVWAKLVSNDEVFRKAGSWAVITGCTNGIGREYALQLAAKGMNVILISRNAQLLEDMALEIGNEYGVRTMIIVMDFTTENEAAYDSIKQQLQGFDIGVLVNNVGIADEPRPYHELPQQKVTDLINVNMLSLAKMCRIVLPDMAIRRRGIVINLSSALGTIPVSFVTLYGASKRFVDIFTRAIENEYKDRNIFVQSVTPFFISTNMTKGVDTEFFIPDAHTYVKNALARVGRETATCGYWPHTLQLEVIKRLPKPILYFLMKVMKSRSEQLDVRRSAPS